MRFNRKRAARQRTRKSAQRGRVLFNGVVVGYRLSDGPSGPPPFTFPDCKHESLKYLALSDSFMRIALWILGQGRKYSVGGHITVSAIEAKWSRASHLRRPFYRSHHSAETLRVAPLTVRRRTYLHYENILADLWQTFVLHPSSPAGIVGDGGARITSWSWQALRLWCAESRGFFHCLTIGIDYACGSLCLWISTIRLKRRGREEKKRFQAALENGCVWWVHMRGSLRLLITLTCLLSVQSNMWGFFFGCTTVLSQILNFLRHKDFLTH